MRIVIDTNLVASALFFGGLPSKLLELVLTDKVNAIATTEIISEYQETDLALAKKVNRPPLDKHLSDILDKFIVVPHVSDVKVCRDPDDDKFINCAIDGKCKYIVSGDKDLLVLKSCENIEIMTVREFIDEYNRF